MENNKRTQKLQKQTSDNSEGEILDQCQEVGGLELTSHGLEILRNNKQLLEEILETNNMQTAWKQVKQNKGAPGIDGLSIEASLEVLRSNWPAIKKSIEQGSYKPQGLRVVEIPKSNGGKRKLSIPTVVDRLIQQAIAQVLSKYIDGSFAQESYGYRPHRSAQQAVLKAKSHIDAGYTESIDLDIEQYFDSVNQDRLMSQLKATIVDQRVLRLIRKILNSITSGNKGHGLPQGGPLSPLLSNIYLDPLDKELKKRGHRFVRYADDCKIFVKTQKSGIRVMSSITEYLRKKLKLKTHTEKSKVSNLCTVLGFIVNCKGIKIMPKSVKHLKDKIREIVKIRGGQSLRVVITKLKVVLRGWEEYYKIQTSKSIYQNLNSWLARRIRAKIYKDYKNGETRYKLFKSAGMTEHVAYSCAYSNYGAWSMALCKPMRIIFSRVRLRELDVYKLGDLR
jgi:RNA-directed DNA polymerase